MTVSRIFLFSFISKENIKKIPKNQTRLKVKDKGKRADRQILNVEYRLFGAIYAIVVKNFVTFAKFLQTGYIHLTQRTQRFGTQNWELRDR